MSPLSENIPLFEIVQVLRTELAASREEARRSPLGVNFVVDSLELELEVAIEKTTTAGAKVAVWVIAAEGGHETKKLQTHKVRLTLKPETSSKEQLKISGLNELAPSD